MKVVYLCPWGHLTGYARAAADNLAMLADDLAMGGDTVEDLAIVPMKPPAVAMEPRYGRLEAYVDPSVINRPAAFADWLWVFHGPPAELPRIRATVLGDVVSVATAAVTTWETEGAPEWLREDLHAAFRRIIVPSRFSGRQLALDDVSSDRVRVVPHAFDPDFWGRAIAELPPEVIGPSRPYRFLHVGAWNERKNTAGVVKAYLHAFDARDNAILLLAGGVRSEHVAALVATSGMPSDARPKIIVRSEPLSEVDLVAMHAGADCYVSATRGEGWGLGLFEAAICNRSIISPFQGGQLDFLENYRHLESIHGTYQPVFPTPHSHRIDQAAGTVTATVDLPRGVTCKQKWFEPNLTEISSRMRLAYDGRVRNTPRIHTELRRLFGYDAVRPRLYAALEEALHV